MSISLDTVILSVPITNPTPAVAPVLLSACLNRGGVSAKGIDFGVEFFKFFIKKPYWKDIKTQFTLGHVTDNNLPKRAIIDILKFNKQFLTDIKNKYNPKSIGLSIFSVESINYSYILIYSIRKYLPGVKIVLGGKGVELVCSHRKKRHADIYYENGLADLVVLGDCEHVIVDVFKNNKYGIYTSPQQTVEDLDARPLPSWDEYDLEQYREIDSGLLERPYIVVSASKGCVRKCTFCDVASFWPKYVYRNPENVAREIITAYEKTGIDHFIFSDNLINGSVSHYRKLNEILAKEIPNTIRYGGYAIFRDKRYMPAEDFELAKLAGCEWWGIGVESGSERLRFEMGKKITDDDLDWSVHHLLKNNIKQKWLLMVGYPSETDQDFKLTLNLLERYAEYASTGMIEISSNPTFMLLNNSPIMQNEKIREDLGLTHNLENEWSDKFWTSTKYPDNIFPLRAERWRILIDTIKLLNYPWNHLGSYEAYVEEVHTMEKFYEERPKVIPITKI